MACNVCVTLPEPAEEVTGLGVLVAVEDAQLLPPEQSEELADRGLAAAAC